MRIGDEGGGEPRMVAGDGAVAGSVGGVMGTTGVAVVFSVVSVAPSTLSSPTWLAAASSLTLALELPDIVLKEKAK